MTVAANRAESIHSIRQAFEFSTRHGQAWPAPPAAWPDSDISEFHDISDNPFGSDAVIDPGQLVRLVVLKSDFIQLRLSIQLARGLL